MFPAQDGDSFLISDSRGHNILLDAGYPDTYKKWIKPRLQELSSSGQTLTLFIISHIDADHISGAITFLEENGSSTDPKIIPIDQIWHNGFRHVQKSLEYSNRQLDSLSKDIIGSINSQPIAAIKGEERSISAKQGSSVGALILAAGYNWNQAFSCRAVTSDADPSIIDISPNIRIRLLSPVGDDLLKLEKYWRKELYKLGFREKIDNNDLFDDAFEFLLMRERMQQRGDIAIPISESDFNIEKLLHVPFNEDSSVTNLSSIAFVLESAEKKLLFLGDSHSTTVIRNLKKSYRPSEAGLRFDFIQVSHHGSFGNNDPEFFKITDSPIYCISTSGEKHGHPDPETMAWIIGRKAPFLRTIYFNYEHKMMRRLNDDSLKSQHHYVVYGPVDNYSVRIII
jgi:beta-lactamase superfamily II metal-dependent hydrolase